ncbi:choice-of-anchor D domain-containing protein [Kribbella pittospori]|nr:choice-of-anchor D domain-containing protein [Kribbella pittospori]
MDEATTPGIHTVDVPTSGPTTGVRASITVGGDLRGQIAVGNNIVQMQIGEVHGNVIMPVDQSVKVDRRPSPLRLLPRRPAAFVDRDGETTTARAVLGDGLSLSFTGGPGIGKSSLLRHLAHQPFIGGSGGIAHLSVRGQPLDDVLHCLFDLCYESDRPYKPTHGQLRHYLQSIDCTILLDDLMGGPDDVAALLDFVPQCRFVISADQLGDLDGLRSVLMSGLSSEFAIEVFANTLGRSLGAQERLAATALSTAVSGVPLSLVQTAAAVRDGLVTLEEAAMTTPELWNEVAARDEPDRRLLATLAALPALRLSAEDLRLASGVADTVARLSDLAASGLVQVAPAPNQEEDGYEVVSGVLESLPAVAVTAARRHVRDYLIAWAQRRPRDPTPTLRVQAGVELLRASAEARRWSDALALARGVDEALALSGRWGTWLQALSVQLTASREISDEAAEAYALHQLGTRSLCLGEVDTARAQLTDALHLREAHGDAAGASVTRHNLGMLPAPPVAGGGDPTSDESWWFRVWSAVRAVPMVVKAFVLLVLTLTVLVTSVALGGWPGASMITKADLIPSALSYQSQLINTASKPLAITVGNPSDETLGIGAVHIAGQHPSDFSITSGTCGRLPADGRCQVSVTFTPTAKGTRKAVLALVLSQAGSEDHREVSLVGTGIVDSGGAMTVVPTRLSFAARPVATSSSAQTVSVRNTTGETRQLGAVRATGVGASDFRLVPGNCRQIKLRRNARCRLQVIFVPSAIGTRSATLRLAVSGEPEVVVPLLGTGVDVSQLPPPTLTVPQAVVQEATGPTGASVVYRATAVDGIGRTLSPMCVPASGSQFAIGTKSVTCTATDIAGHSATAAFQVTVRDTRPPQLELPGDLTVEAESKGGAWVRVRTPSASDVVSGTAKVECSLSSRRGLLGKADGSRLFPLGTTNFDCSATDAAGNTADGTFSVSVVDTTPPDLIVPTESISVEGSSQADGADVDYEVSASDKVDGPITPHCEPASGEHFEFGTKEVTCDATDRSGNTSHASFTVIVNQPVG